MGYDVKLHISLCASTMIDDGQVLPAGTKEATGADGRPRCAAADAAYPGSCSNIIDPFSLIQFNSINLIIQISSCRGSRQPAPHFFFILVSPLSFVRLLLLCWWHGFVPWTMTVLPLAGAADRLDETGHPEE